MNSHPRVEEYHVIGAVTLAAFKDDKADFIDFSPEFEDPFETDFEDQITAATGIATTQFYTAELAGLTERIKIDKNLIYPMLTFLEGYINLAKKNLSKPPKLFGIKAVRDKARSENSEGLRIAFDTLKSNVEVPSDFALLQAKGLTDPKWTALKDLAVKLMKENDDQEYYKTKKAKAITDNWGLFDDLLDTIKKVQDTGKRLYKYTNKAKTDGYTMTVLLGRIRHDELHTLITGKVYDKTGTVAAGAKIVARPSSEGLRGKTVTSKADGKYELKGLKPVNYTLTVTLKNGGVFVTNVTAVTNESVVVDLKEPV
jgi:hypothetical protein